MAPQLPIDPDRRSATTVLGSRTKSHSRARRPHTEGLKRADKRRHATTQSIVCPYAASAVVCTAFPREPLSKRPLIVDGAFSEDSQCSTPSGTNHVVVDHACRSAADAQGTTGETVVLTGSWRLVTLTPWSDSYSAADGTVDMAVATRTLTAAALVALMALSSQWTPVAAGGAVQVLTDGTFDAALGTGGVWLVKFYAVSVGCVG